MKQTCTVQMVPSRTTKGTYMFEAKNKFDAHIKNIYVDKQEFRGEAPPAEATLTFTYDDGK
jgi:hypothetical protein